MKKGVGAMLLVIAILIVGGMVVYQRRAARLVKPETIQRPAAETTETDQSISGVVSTRPPETLAKEITLTVSSPKSGTTVQSASITIQGKTAPRAEVFINEFETKADASGNFSYPVSLDEGENILIVMANDADGNLAEAEVIVTYEPAQ